MSEAKKKANDNYEKKRIIKPVSFNTVSEKDLLDFVDSINFSEWVKQKIRSELEATS